WYETPILGERLFDGRDSGLLQAGGGGEEHGGRVGRVEADHPFGERHDVGGLRRGREVMANGEPRAALVIGDSPHGCHRRVSRPSGWPRARGPPVRLLPAA